MMFETEQLVSLAKRENNQKRAYLYVNPLQGKHIPVLPHETKKMCRELAEEAVKRYANEKLLIIGFAETATAIAAYVAGALSNAVYFVNTTREKEIKGEEYIYFSESHSHAVEQKLNAESMDKYLSLVDRVLFVEDEVTTGNTICKLIKAIKGRFPATENKFSIVSVLNSMCPERMQELAEAEIECLYLKKIPFEYRADMIEVYEKIDECMYDRLEGMCNHLPAIYTVAGGENQRRLCRVEAYKTKVEQFCAHIYEHSFRNEKFGEILVLGTEEFMYPAIELAGYLSDKGVGDDIRSHSTTRSPIMAFDKEMYPLRSRYKLISLYDDERVTYLYNLKKYDKVIIVTDSELKSKKGLQSLTAALKMVGNDDIIVYQWSV